MTEPKHTLVWNNCLNIIRDIIRPQSYRTWFEPVKAVRISGAVLTIEVPSNFFREYLEEHYIDLISKALKRELGKEAKLEYNVRVVSGEDMVTFPQQPTQEIKNKSVPFPNQAGNITNPFVIPGLQQLEIDPQLNPHYSFENFIEGECNKLARSAGLNISANPGKGTFNPLFLYGGSGLGKTHLAQAIGISIKKQFPEKIVLYVSANRFQTQYMDATTVKNKLTDFLHFYQLIDVLIIDDVHEFAGKPGTQNAFFHIFSHLHSMGKQLILTSDKAPVDLQDLEMRLLSRFKWGLLAELLPPDYNTRVEILKAKSYKDGITLPEEVTNYIASRVSTNIREIEGTLISLLAQSTLTNRKINLDLAESLIEKLVTKNKPEISVDRIQKIVCEYFRIDPQQFLSASRKRELVQARQISMYLSRNLTKSSLASIGTQTGGRDHATVLHAYNTVCDLLDTDRSFRKYVVDIEKQLKSN
ncbi:MAG: chromosomal replication initiation protein DnaA [Bacteroidetes bacterium GWE2_39_28]|nr:MAG: chromosomal replication initiation protein DnaA [Bacteroidetes bacterium GWE2_39_28]OFY12795.1 MAG: chromosomal replication initiation protein DnaA [Bacteroidetes bacterium GWF2_39_10]OFZ11020.1 MAG: chromosomal replication initiation protein DnaA [Bacteroidetes bacterium RIFOXYC2_FULL_39_11]HCT93728.1 chromosomal replication initiator protein DnaA [Rikenellaceae bacterium]HCV15148.1 chromosomal replication initiator protein DnaA [Rikenellaceae bacterium]